MQEKQPEDRFLDKVQSKRSQSSTRFGRFWWGAVSEAWKFLRNFDPDIVGKKKARKTWIITIVVIALLLSPLIGWAVSNQRH
jgi:hypothetical protein